MFLKTFRYRIKPAKMGEYLAIRQQADAIYHRFLPQSPTYLQSATDPYQWLEMYHYNDESSYRVSLEQMQQDEELAKLWIRFQAILDPTYPAAVDEYRYGASTNGEATESWSESEYQSPEE